ncbi:MAG: fumarylacetoacetase [Egibacteraceae bacterium]
MTAPADTDPQLTSWVPSAQGSPFPIQNLPYGVFSHDEEEPRVGVAIGDRVLDLAALAWANLLEVPKAAQLFQATSLNPFLGRGRWTWQTVRRNISDLLSGVDPRLREDSRLSERALLVRDELTLHLPFQPGDYVDFYSSLEHATNLGRLFRPDGDPLLPNWRHLPVGYHGRSSTVVVSGTPIIRPRGQRRPEPGGIPPFGPTEALDIELELGFVTGPGNTLGTPIPADRAAEHIFGVVLVNDWSARDIQAWEYQPLGPFLGKSFATSVSPWVVPLEALAPHRVPHRAQEPEPLPYLRTTGDWAFDIDFEVVLQPAGGEPTTISRTNARRLYWSCAQQLAHTTVNGCAVRPGDLYASGTISGSERGTEGSLIELTRRGAEPLTLPSGAQRTFLEDGDTVILRGVAGGGGRPAIGLGEVVGTIAPAPT